MSNYANMNGIYGETLVNNYDRTKTMITKYNQMVTGEVKSSIDAVNDELKLRFDKAVSDYNPALTKDGYAEWGTHEFALDSYLTEIYSDMVSASKDGKVTRDELLDKVDQDIQNGTFAKKMKEYGVDVDNSLGKNFFYPSELTNLDLPKIWSCKWK